jgi:hypothetical protein
MYSCTNVHVFLIYLKAEGRSEAGKEKGQNLERVERERRIEEKRREQKEAEAVTRLVSEEQIVEEKRREQKMQEKQEAETVPRLVREEQKVEEKRREQRLKEKQEAEAVTRLVREEQRVEERLQERRPQEAQEVKTGPILAADKNRNEEWRLREKQGMEAIKRLDGEDKLQEKQDAEAVVRLEEGRQTNLQDKKEPAKLQSLQGDKAVESAREAVQSEKSVLKISPVVPAQETQGFKTISVGQTVRPVSKKNDDNANRSGEKSLSFGLQDDDSSFVKTEETNAKMSQDKNMNIRTSIDQNNNEKKNIDQNQNIKKRQDQNFDNNVRVFEDDTNNAKKFESQNAGESQLKQDADSISRAAKNSNIGTSFDGSSNARTSPDQQSSTKTSQNQNSDAKAAQDQKLTSRSQNGRGGDQLTKLGDAQKPGALTNDQREKHTRQEVASNLEQKEHRKLLEAQKTQKEFSLGRNDTKSKTQPTETVFSKSDKKEELNATLADIRQENNKTLQIAPKTHQVDDQASWSGKMKENTQQPSAAPFRHVSRQVNLNLLQA